MARLWCCWFCRVEMEPVKLADGTLAVIGVVSWSTGPNMSDGCGGLTGVTPLTRYRGWIVEQARKMGNQLQ